MYERIFFNFIYNERKVMMTYHFLPIGLAKYMVYILHIQFTIVYDNK